MKQLKITKQITNRESESLDKYLQEIGKVSLITTEEEVDLAKRIREGDPRALEKLTKANLRFVVSVAKQYQNRGLQLNDLINEGNVGLIKAGLRFDETRGFKFISYAVWWIRQAIIQALAEQSRVVRLPLNRVGSVARILKMHAQLEQSLQRDPTVTELAEKLETTEEDIHITMSASQKTISADAPMHFDDSTSMMETIQDVNSLSPDSSLMDKSES
jgi:RNA polymerase primary sigma factor